MPKKPEPKVESKPELRYELEGAPPSLFVVYEVGSCMWMLPEGKGWSSKLLFAGAFSEEKARELAAEHHVLQPLDEAVRNACAGANPVVLAAIAALGGR